MGYYSMVSGYITINPPLSHAEIMRNEDWFMKDDGVDLEIRFTMYKEVKDTDEGLLTSYHAGYIIPWTEDSGKFYGLEDAVQKIVSEYPRHEYSGYLHVEGEENGDIWRLYVRQGKVVRVEAELKWPEGYEE